MWPKQVREREDLFGLRFKVPVITEGNLGKNSLIVKDATEIKEEHYLLVHFRPGPPTQGMVPSTVGLAFLHQLTIKTTPPIMPLGHSDLGNPSTEIPFSDDSGLCQIDSSSQLRQPPS